jgi:CHC2 zinc finger
MAALSALRCNPAVRALYRRVVAKHPQRKASAVGHARRKLLHLVFAVWKTDKPFDPHHYPWQQTEPASAAASDNALLPQSETAATSDHALSMTEQAAGHKPEQTPARTVVAAACDSTLADDEPAGEDTFLDFTHLKQQLPLAKVLDHLGLSSRLRGRGSQRRGACPLQRGDGRGRTFSVNLDDHVFHCFDKGCGQHGDVLDLWAALHQQSLRAAALELVRTFNLEPAPQAATEKRHG